MILGLLDGLCRLLKRHADADVVDCELEPQDVFDHHSVDDFIFLLREQLHRVLLLVLLFDELIANRVNHILLALIVINVVGLVVIAKEKVVNNSFDNFETDDEL